MVTINDAAQHIGIDYLDDEMTRANLQRALERMVNKAFDKFIGKSMEAYVDDLVVKSSNMSQHLSDLAESFEVMRNIGMKLNPKKSFFGMTGGKFLGFIVSERGIEVNPVKCKAILDMPEPTCAKEVQILTDRIAVITRFISK